MFDDFFKQATGRDLTPYPYQRAFAENGELPDLLNVPTGVGKTATAILGWLYRRRRADQVIRDRTPRRLVYCLPMRTLVEQTRDCAVMWLDRLGQFAGTVEYADEAKSRVKSYTLDFNKLPNGIAVHVLMGGADASKWDERPERDAILIGTQDMLLSRALNRGYAARRGRWPTEFGLLLNDSLWVFDEVQLMGNGLATSVQLDAFGKKVCPPLKATRFLWMSATLGSDLLKTRDREDWGLSDARSQELTAADREHPEINRRLMAPKRIEVRKDRPPASAVLDAHVAGRISLVVLNTVPSAKEFHRELTQATQPQPTKGRKKKSTASAEATRPLADVVLLHGRFRSMDRDRHMRRLTEFLDNMDRETGAVPNHPGLVVVSTQVIEAGFDLSSARMWSEISPWSSAVQRLGRLNREGRQPDASAVFWMPKANEQNKGDGVPNAKRIGPYDKSALDASQKLLKLVETGQANGESYRAALDVALATPESLKAMQVEPDAVIRPADFFGLFSTEPDLAGGFTNVAPFVRSQDRDVDIHVFWRDFDPTKSGDWSQSEPSREELCAVPYFEFRTFLGKSGVAWEWNFETEEWERRRAADVQPGMTLLLPKSAGGYRGDMGWTAVASDRDFEVMPDRGETGDGFDADRWSGFQGWLKLDDHLRDVEAEAAELINVLELNAASGDALVRAGRWHDWGKGIEAWQQAVAKFVDEAKAKLTKIRDDATLAELHSVVTDWLPHFEKSDVGKSLWAKFPDPRGACVDQRLTHLSDEQKAQFLKRLGTPFRPGLRHEAASALAAWQAWRDGDTTLSALAVYLIASHHGKVRTVLRSRTRKDEVFGLSAGNTLPPVAGVFDDEATLNTDCRCVGASGEWNANRTEFVLRSPSWLQMVTELLGSVPGGPPVTHEVIPDHEPRELGPIALAYLEALLVAADVRASRNPGKGGRS